jgi:hypothetical protein
MDLENNEYFPILDAIRESGKMNMYGAPSWLVENCDLTKDQAKEIFRAWTKTFSVSDDLARVKGEHV